MYTRRHVWRLLLLTWVLGAPLAMSIHACSILQDPPTTRSATVTRVIDGDTIKASGFGTVRMIGIDTPETVDPDQEPEPYGYAASDYTKQHLTGEQVRIELGQDPEDPYGRTLAYVWIANDRMYQEKILATGLAEVLIIEPNDEYQERLQHAEDLARRNQLGMWQK